MKVKSYDYIIEQNTAMGRGHYNIYVNFDVGKTYVGKIWIMIDKVRVAVIMRRDFNNYYVLQDVKKAFCEQYSKIDDQSMALWVL